MYIKCANIMEQGGNVTGSRLRVIRARHGWAQQNQKGIYWLVTTRVIGGVLTDIKVAIIDPERNLQCR